MGGTSGMHWRVQKCMQSSVQKCHSIASCLWHLNRNRDVAVTQTATPLFLSVHKTGREEVSYKT
jgi:hypothetical protein